MKKLRYTVTIIDHDNPECTYVFRSLMRSDVNVLWHQYADSMDAIFFIKQEYVEDDD